MLLLLDRYVRGYLLVRLTGYSPERFLNLCKSNHILIWGLVPKEDSYEFYMKKRDFYKARVLLKKSKTRLRIREKHGFPFFLHRYRKRRLSFAALLLAFLLLYGMSLFIWDIEFEGNYSYSQESLLQFLSEQGVHHGIRKDRLICDEIEQEIRNAFPDITWVSAEISGTRLVIQIRENYGLMNVQEENTEPADLIADKTGIITEIVTRSGVPMVKAGDTVEKGQVLVSGAVPVTNDSGEIISYQMVRSDADILVRANEPVALESDSFLEERDYTGKSRTGFFICLGSFRFQLFGKGFSGAESQLTVKESQVKLFENFYLPIRFGSMEQKEYVSYSRNLTQEEAKENVEKKLSKMLEQYKEQNMEILEQDVQFSWNGIQYQAVGTITTEGKIGIFQAAENPGGQEETKSNP